MSPSLVIHLRVDAKPCTIAVRMGRDCSYESIELLLPLLAPNLGLRGANGRCGGEFIQREEFVAKKIGHDLARTNYQVTRTNRSAPGSEQDAAETQTAIVSETEAAHASSGW